MNRTLAAGLSLAAVAVTTALALPRSALATGDVTAGDITIDPTPFVGIKTRAQVREELLQSGPQVLRDTEWSQQQADVVPFKSTLTPQEARDQYRAARDQVDAFNGEDSGSGYLKAHPATGNPAATMGGPGQ